MMKDFISFFEYQGVSGSLADEHLVFGIMWLNSKWQRVSHN